MRTDWIIIWGQQRVYEDTRALFAAICARKIVVLARMTSLPSPAKAILATFEPINTLPRRTPSFLKIYNGIILQSAFNFKQCY